MIKDESLKYQNSDISQSFRCQTHDNLTEVLNYIISFTQARQKILIMNINQADTPGFIPHDLPLSDFADILNLALDEHIQNERLIFCDTKNIKFQKNGYFNIQSCPDYHSAKILKKSKNQYIELQINKLLENTLNQKFAAETLKQKQIIRN